MKKKILSIAAVCAALCFAAGCGSGTPAEQTSAPASAASGSETPGTAADEVLYDGNGVKITAKGFKKSDGYDGGAMLELGIENGTGKPLFINLDRSSVNRLMCTPEALTINADGTYDLGSSFDVPAEAGGEVYGIYLCGFDGAERDPRNIEQTSFAFEIVIGDDWDNEVNTDLLTVTNPGFSADYDTVYDEHGDVAYDKDGIKIVVQDADHDSEYWGPTVNILVHNESGSTVDIRVQKAALNGEEHECWNFMTVTPGCYLMEELLFDGASEVQPLGTFTAEFEVYTYSPDGDGELIGSSGPVTVEF